MDDIRAWIEGGLVVAGLGLGYRAILWFAPGFLAKKIHEAIKAIKISSWLRNSNHPKRRKAFVALMEWLEDEIPEPGQGRSFYAYHAEQVASWLRFGSPPAWAKALEAFGDKLDTQLDADLKEIGTDSLAPEQPTAEPPKGA